MLPKQMKDDLKSGAVLKKDPYRVFLENEQEDIVWISSCPLKHGTEKGQKHGFVMRGDRLSEGSNACLKQSKTEIVLCGEQVSLRFPFAFLQCLEKHDSFLHEKYCDVLQSDCGILYPTSNGFAVEARGKVKIQFSSGEPVHLYNLDEYCLIFDRNDRIVFSVNCILENMQVRPKFRTESNGTDHVVEVIAAGGHGMILTFNAYAPKRFFDTPLDAGNPSRNHVYAENAYLGREEDGGQWLALRPDCAMFSDLYDRGLKDAKLFFRNLNGALGKVFYGELRFFWCTYTTVWETREMPREWLEAETVTEESVQIDLTSYLRGLFREKAQATPGIVVQSTVPLVLPTGDNYLCPVFLRIRFEHISAKKARK